MIPSPESPKAPLEAQCIIYEQFKRRGCMYPAEDVDELLNDLRSAGFAVAPDPPVPVDLEASRDNWMEQARQYCSNMEYYRGLVDECAKHLGEAVYIQDDGGKSDSVLRAKVPELVAALRSRISEVEGVRTPEWMEQAWNEIYGTMHDTMLNNSQRRTFILAILKGQLANPPKPQPGGDTPYLDQIGARENDMEINRRMSTKVEALAVQVGETREATPLDSALSAAVSAIYFGDSSDYGTALWQVVENLNPEICAILESDERAAYEATHDANGNTKPFHPQPGREEAK